MVERDGLKGLTESHRLTARAEALADARLGWAESNPTALFHVVTGRSWAEYVDGALTEIFEIYTNAWCRESGLN